MGDDTLGMIPGSLTAADHKKIREKTTLTADTINIARLFESKNMPAGSNPSATADRNDGKLSKKCIKHPAMISPFVRNKLGASDPNMSFPRRKKAWFPIQASAAVNCVAGSKIRPRLAHPDRPPTETKTHSPEESIPWEGTTADRRSRPVTPPADGAAVVLFVAVLVPGRLYKAATGVSGVERKR